MAVFDGEWETNHTVSESNQPLTVGAGWLTLPAAAATRLAQQVAWSRPSITAAVALRNQQHPQDRRPPPIARVTLTEALTAARTPHRPRFRYCQCNGTSRPRPAHEARSRKSREVRRTNEMSLPAHSPRGVADAGPGRTCSGSPAPGLRPCTSAAPVRWPRGVATTGSRCQEPLHIPGMRLVQPPSWHCRSCTRAARMRCKK